ncbi:MAG: aminoglycoside phosphotransferase family protein [Alphaproteobacteria bacterium]|nr:MAG: aminoglycoside phosphotransferase family protein [Alphaproteobacteria bacterium]
MTALRRPILIEPPGREQKPQPADLPPAITRQLEKLVHAKVAHSTYASGGLSVSAAFIFTLDNGKKIFAKGSHPGDTAHGAKNLAQEVFVYECVDIVRNISPPYLGLVSDGEEDGWMLGVWECVDHDPNKASVDRVVASLNAWQRTPSAKALLPTARQHVYISQLLSGEKKWLRLRIDEMAKKKFYAMFQNQNAARAWLDKNLSTLCTYQQRAEKMRGEEGLMHGDLRIDNFLFGEQTWVIDWPNACWGPLVFDLMFLFSNMEAMGFGSADNMIAAYTKVTGKMPEPDDQVAVLTALSGYFADQAYREVVEKMPRLRWMQKSMLLAQLRILARFGIIESPPALVGENQ